MIDNYIRDGRSPIPEKEVTSRVMRGNKSKNTKPELLARRLLWKNGIKGYRLHWNKIPGRPDIAFPGRKVAIFVNGCYWHRCPYCKIALPKKNTEFWKDKFKKNVERDTTKTQQLNDLGWNVLTIWECQLIKDPAKVLDKVRNILNR